MQIRTTMRGHLTSLRMATIKKPINKMLGRMKHKLEARLSGEITITSDMQMTPPLWQKVKRN